MKKEDLRSKYIVCINRLLQILGASPRAECVEEAFSGTITILENLYGRGSNQLESLKDSRRNIQKKELSIVGEMSELAFTITGILRNVKSEVEAGLIESIEVAASGAVVADFVAFAKAELADGGKDVAAVLSSAALEDALKRKAMNLGLNVEGKEMSTVIDALKSRALFSGAQGSTVTSFIRLRNAAMHADWDRIDKASVAGLIAFLDVFLAEHFS